MSVQVNIERFFVGSVQSPLIEGCSLNLDEADVVALVGPSGAGKTTLLRMIAGLETNYSGSIMVGNQPVVGPRRAVQLVFQERRLLPWRTVRGNVELALAPQTSAHDRKRVVDEALESVGVLDLADRWPKNLSGGEQTRTALARALVGAPSVLLLDEPFADVDVATKVQLQKVIDRLREDRGVTILLTSHDVHDAVYFSDVVHVVSRRPLRVHSTHIVEAVRPRQIGDPELLRLEESIRTEVLEHGAPLAVA